MHINSLESRSNSRKQLGGGKREKRKGCEDERKRRVVIIRNPTYAESPYLVQTRLGLFCWRWGESTGLGPLLRRRTVRMNTGPATRLEEDGEGVFVSYRHLDTRPDAVLRAPFSLCSADVHN